MPRKSRPGTFVRDPLPVTPIALPRRLPRFSWPTTCLPWGHKQRRDRGVRCIRLVRRFMLSSCDLVQIGAICPPTPRRLLEDCQVGTGHPLSTCPEGSRPRVRPATNMQAKRIWPDVDNCRSPGIPGNPGNQEIQAHQETGDHVSFPYHVSFRRTTPITRRRREIVHLKTPDFAARVHWIVRWHYCSVAAWVVDFTEAVNFIFVTPESLSSLMVASRYL